MLYKNFNKLVPILIAGVLLFPLFKVNAQLVQKPELKDALNEVVKIKDGDTETLENQKNALKKISELTALEIKDLQSQLGKLKDLGVDHIELKNRFFSDLENYLANLESFNEELNAGNLTLDSIKNLAAKLKTWRESVYDPATQNIATFLLIYRGQSILKITDDRYDKISSDIKKLASAKMVKTDALEILLNEAATDLKTAHAFNNEAKSILNKLLEVKEINGEQNAEEKFQLSDVQEMVKKSLAKVRVVYQIFFEMSSLVKKLM